MRWFKYNRIGIDLGTTNTYIHIPSRRTILRESSIIAINKHNNEVVAYGNDAKKMMGKTPIDINTIAPLQRGVIADPETASLMLKLYVKLSQRKFSGFMQRQRAIICVSTGSNSVENRAVLEVAKKAGIYDVWAIESIMATALGANLPVEEAAGVMVMNIGGGTTETAVFSLSGIAAKESVKIAGQEMDMAIKRHIQKTHDLIIGHVTAETIKIQIGAAYLATQQERDIKMAVCGRDLWTGLPKTIHITAGEVEQALREPLSIIIDSVRKTLEKTPPELSSDVFERGIVVAGGGALLKNFNTMLSQSIGIPVSIAENPLDCVVLGTSIALKWNPQPLVHSSRRSTGKSGIFA